MTEEDLFEEFEHGGRREGAGGGAKTALSTRQAQAEMKLRKETALVAKHELDLKVKTGEYVSRAAVRQASATAIASIAQTLRSIPDNLERRHGVTPELAVIIGDAIDAAMDQLADEFELMSGD